MFNEHDDFLQPASEDVKIWRYMNLEKLMSLLEEKALYFTRADKFEDPFEGTLPANTLAQVDTYFTGFANGDEMRAEMLNLFAVQRKMILINCWYVSDYESDAMWKLYSKDGVAIQTTYGKLKRSFNMAKEDVRIGLVKYIDYDTATFDFLNGLIPFLHKRNSFEHEKELRAVHMNLDVERELIDENDVVPINIAEHGINIATNLNDLIDTIYISPLAPIWFRGIIEKILKRYGVSKPIVHSKLYTVSDVASIINESNTKFAVSKEVLDYFLKKDASRVDVENSIKERATKQIKDGFDKELDDLKKSYSEIQFIRDKTYNGRAALDALLTKSVKPKELKNLSKTKAFNQLYFLTGKVDNFKKDVTASKLDQIDKSIMLKKLVFWYSEHLCPFSVSLCSRLEQVSPLEENIKAFMKFTSKMVEYINESKF